MGHLRGRAGFSLIELLVVTAIIALLAAMVYSVVFYGLEMGRQTRCLSQLRQIGLALKMYREDWEPSSSGVSLTSPNVRYPLYGLPPTLLHLWPHYLNARELLICPDDTLRHEYRGTVISYTYQTWAEDPKDPVDDGVPLWSRLFLERGEDYPIVVDGWHTRAGHGVHLVLRMDGRVERVTRKINDSYEL